MEYIKSTKIYFEDGLKDGYLVVDKNKIVGYLDCTANVQEYEDYGNNRIIPGIFDTHNHGTYGYSTDYNNWDDEKVEYDIRGYLKSLTFEGVTSVLATADPQIYGVFNKVIQEGYKGANLIGYHSEGPYLNRVGEKGRPMPHPEIDLELSKQYFIDVPKDKMKLVAIAPEIPKADQLAKLLIKNGVKVAYAHSDLKAEGAKKAVDLGWSIATHTSNVMVGLHHRDIGGLGVMLTDDRIDCEVICDGLHVNLEFVDIMFKIKGYDRFMMISDSSSLAGIACGTYDFGWHLPVTCTEEGFLVDSDGRLCGSSKSVLFGIKNLVETLHIPMEDVIKMASLNPCKVYGIDKQKGSISLGKDADFVVIDDKYNALATYVSGECVFDRKLEKPLFNPRFQK